ncbi:formate dehydrogenase accessory sulfurtransferase FdhD [Brevibacillus choshinensis]|uniref:formate dehydrogenase accessory sulfurtransferase FdhD n=1 Tax=Brevibacillus choshinensis TaxID=54911 RepID=UPI00191C1B52|nr:formate dehydrogenase accessory sulfurtransferase FdhD [Brevibacillus choshinensis]
MQPVHVLSHVLHYENGSLMEVEDSIVTESPITIMLNQDEFATLVCSPEYIEELVIGFLASEGVISVYTDITDLFIDETTGHAYVQAKKANKYNQMFHSKRYVTSCCGKSRQSFYFYNDARTVKKVEAKGVSISSSDCFRFMQEMQQSAELFQYTGGVHNAALCDTNGIILSRMDIGRHNALDKLYGYCLQHSLPVEDKIMVFSGRISSEVLLKVAKIGCSIVLSKSAPTELALRLANELGITTVGFIRNQSFNVYTWPERIAEVERGESSGSK